MSRQVLRMDTDRSPDRIPAAPTAERNVLWHDHPPYYQLRGAGFAVLRNRSVPPMYRNRAAREYRLRPGSPATGYGPSRIQPR
jgi:hypothetical protein